MPKHMWSTVAILVMVVLAFGSVPSGQPNLGNQKDGEGRSELSVTSHQFSTGEFGSKKITGTVRNASNKNFSYVQVQINLYDANGTQVGSTMANTNNLEPNGTWRFEALVIEKNVASYKIMDVSGH